mmetsp:Transcript_16924/g.25463  ORF Transcript_16924/g.25463 Transcript_16924/m.25463 type:complete len:404 (+) Transcript_16924:64-1275(+)
MPVKNSRLGGLYKKSVDERRSIVGELASLSSEDIEALAAQGELSEEIGDRMIENVIGSYSLPIGIATNFIIDDKHYLIPFCLEEASVVAAASNAAKRCHVHGGFRTSIDDPIMIAQIELRDVISGSDVVHKIEAHSEELRKICNEAMSSMVKRGGGFRGVEARALESLSGPIVIVHLLLDCRDAMGANAVNTVAEAAAPTVARLAGLDEDQIGLRILSNLATHRLARAQAIFTPTELAAAGDEANIVDAIVRAYHFAAVDPFRACTNNKGVMNAISSIALACGQDWRAIEAGAHAYCAWKKNAQNTPYIPMTTWSKDPNSGNLLGSIEIPLTVGLVGGAVKIQPAARANINILGISSAAELAKIMVAAGLAQNLAALRALATDGIQKGHMRLHARSREDQKTK